MGFTKSFTTAMPNRRRGRGCVDFKKETPISNTPDYHPMSRDAVLTEYSFNISGISEAQARSSQNHTRETTIQAASIAATGFEPAPEQTFTQNRTNNTGLPENLKSGIEHLSGYSMDDVKVHYNSAKPTLLQAHAYTRGSEIHIAPGQERHLPHEAWHVVQQKQGRVKPTMQMKGDVKINDDKYLEREADAMGEKAFMLNANAQHRHALRDCGSFPFNTTTGAKDIFQRVEVGDRPFEGGYKNVLNDPSWMPKAEAYEKRLGLYASHVPVASNALDKGISKMYSVFNKYYHDKFQNDQQGILRKLFFRDDKTSAGQVGLNLNVWKMLETLNNGNLRERMTAFYNASYYGAGYGGNIQEGFKAILHDIIFSGKWDESNQLGLDTASLKEQGKFMDSWSRTAIHKAISTIKEEKAYNYGKDIFALGNLAYQTDDPYFTNTWEIAESQKDRTERAQNDKDAHRKTPEDYANMGVPLSDKELAYLYPDIERKTFSEKFWYTAEGFRREKTKTNKLSWEEGTALFEISPDNSWYKRIHDQLKMPVVAGVSGTTTRLLSSFKWLNTGANPLNFRLAIMGWMLTSWDHSLYEIFKGSHMAGVKGDKEDDTIKDAIRMYMNIPPLTVEQLRDNVAENKMFPHEFIYHKQALEKDANKPQAVVPGESPGGTDVAETGKSKIYDSLFGYKKAEYSKLSEAHAIAIYTYTSGAHNILNSVMSFNMSETMAKRAIKGKLQNIITYFADRYYLHNKKQKGTISPEESKKLTKLESEEVEWINVLTPKYTAVKDVLGDPDMTELQREQYMDKYINGWLDKLVDTIYPELQMHANMTVEGLDNLPAVNGATVWRGDWVSAVSTQYNKGKTVNFDTFTSFSRKRSTGEEFATGGKLSYKMLIKLDLKGKSGKDISGLSMYSSEEEVLLMPGAKMSIQNASWTKIKGDDVWFVEAVEV